MFVITFIDFQD